MKKQHYCVDCGTKINLYAMWDTEDGKPCAYKPGTDELLVCLVCAQEFLPPGHWWAAMKHNRDQASDEGE